MAISADTTLLDAPFDDIVAAATAGHCRQVLCGTEPTTYTEASATYMLADTGALASNQFTKAADSGGRKVTVTAQTGVSVTTPGTAYWVCLIDTDSELILVKTSYAAGKALTDTVDIGAWAIHNPQPVLSS
jgi:hypothetical protein